MRVPPVENPTCTAFNNYKEIPETVPLDFLEDNVTWVVSKISGAAGALGAEAIEQNNWLLLFGYASEEFRVVVSDLVDWMANSPPPCYSYRALMACCLVALNKRPGVRPVRIGETINQAIAKLAMRVMGDQDKTSYMSLQLCAGLEAGIEGATHAVAQRRR